MYSVVVSPELYILISSENVCPLNVPSTAQYSDHLYMYICIYSKLCTDDEGYSLNV